MSSVLVTYASKRGGTAGIAESIASNLRQHGFVVDCTNVAKARDLERYDAIVIGGALYGHRWLGAASRFVRRNARIMRGKVVWLFSSGPLDDSASFRDAPTVPQVAALMARVHARGHITFGGRLEAGASGLIASAMAKHHTGDWRDWRRIRDWSSYLATELEHPTPLAVSAPEASARWPLAALCFAVAVTAIIGGGALVMAPDGSLLHASRSLLVHSPFSSFTIPGLILAGVVGLSNALAGLQVTRDRPNANTTAGLAGAALLGWIVTEMIMLRSANVLQLGYMIVAITILFASSRRRQHGRHVATAS